MIFSKKHKIRLARLMYLAAKKSCAVFRELPPISRERRARVCEKKDATGGKKVWWAIQNAHRDSPCGVTRFEACV
jgi:hypothetical protein